MPEPRPVRPAGVLAPLASAVRAGRTSAVALVAEAARRIEAARDLNAVVALRVEAALDEAAGLDRRVRAGDDPGPLAGLPLLVKDIEDAAGLVTTHGSLLHASDPPAERNGLVPSRLVAAGAIVLGKTNTPEFAFQGYTDNRLFGATLNPWARDWSPGGSSGGSGAALAAGLAPLATATDGGGSIRIPAALCGLAGIKPTNGVVGRDPIPDWIDLSTDGPLAQTVADLRLLLETIGGPVAGDPTAQVGWRLGSSRSPRRILATPRLGGDEPIDPDVAAAFEAALGAIEADLGLPVERIAGSTVFPAGYRSRDWFEIAGVEQAHRLGRERIERDADRLDPTFRRWMEAALGVSIADHLAARRRRFVHVRELDTLLGDETLLVCPTVTVPGWTPDGRLPGAERPGLPSAVFNTEVVNLTGHPALSLPAGRLPNGLPFGLQAVGPRYREALLFGFAEAWERARPWPLVADGYAVFGAELGRV